MRKLHQIIHLSLSITVSTLALASQELWYDEPAELWVEALPVGNGHLGGMVFGGTSKERIQFNEGTLYVGEPHDYSRPDAHKSLDKIRELIFEGRQKEVHAFAMKEFMSNPMRQMPYQPFADIQLQFPGHESPQNYRRSLELENAIARTQYEIDGVQFTREVIASYPDNIIAIRIAANKAGQLNFSTTFNSPHPNSQIQAIDKSKLQLTGALRKSYMPKRKEFTYEIENPLRFEAQLEVRPEGGSVQSENGQLKITNADAVTLILTAATSFKNFQDVSGDPHTACEKVLAALENKDWDEIKADHLADYQALYQRVSIDLGSSENEALPTDDRLLHSNVANDNSFNSLLFQYGRYLLIASSRQGGQPANLQGIWNDKMMPPWGSRYTININFEMNYWPAELTNLAECHEPFFAAVEDLVISGRRTAKNHYNARGWMVHHNFDLWRGTAPINHANHGIWPTGGAWLCQHLWWHYEFGGDQAFLEKIYPILRESALFFVDFLIEDHRNEKGWLISIPSHSPEHGGMVAGATMDHQLIRGLFTHVIDASEILDTDAEFRKQLIEMRAKIAPNQIGKHGQLQEWLEDKDKPGNKHRHVSHLWGLHPGEEINWQDTPELFEAAKQSLTFRGDGATGWSMGWKVNFWARFLDGDHAKKILNNLMTMVGRKGMSGKGGGLYPNLFDAHPPFQIDGNFGVTAGIAEMLLQSHIKTEDNTRLLHLLPALPSAWPEGSISGLRARDGFEVSLKWENGEVVAYKIASSLGKPCAILVNGKQKQLNLAAGESYIWQK